MCDQLKPLGAAVAPFVLHGFIDGDKEILSLSPIIYLVDCIAFFRRGADVALLESQRLLGFIAVGDKYISGICVGVGHDSRLGIN